MALGVQGFFLGGFVMGRQHLIREIFNKIPGGNRGINKLGFHVVSITQSEIPMYATLEKLSRHKLQKLALQLGVMEAVE